MSDYKARKIDIEKIKAATPALVHDNIQIFNTWTRERESIRLKREQNELKPWTTNPVLQKWRFCNVRREDDKVTKWYITNIATTGLTYEEKIVNTILFRMFNKPSTIQYIGLQTYNDWFNIAKINELVKTHKNADHKQALFTNVFQVTGFTLAARRHSTEGNEIETRVYELVKSYHETNVCKKLLACTEMYECFNVLQDLDGIGPFLGYQVLMDLTYCPEFHIENKDFVYAGPGARAGLKRLFNDRGGLSCEEAIHWLALYQESIYLTSLPRLKATDIEHSLCEVDKYIRAIQGQPLKVRI